MGHALQLNTGYALNPSSTFTAITMNAGEYSTVNAFDPSKRAVLFAPFSPGATAGVARIRSPRLHDFAQGIRMQRGAAVFEPLLTIAAMQPVYPADALTLEVTGGASETDMLGWLQFFEDLPGIQARLAAWADISSRIRNVLGVEVDTTSGGTAGQYGTARALNFSFDTLKASTDYAILGYEVSAKVGVVCIYGPDTGNQHVGGPGMITPNWLTTNWFKKLSDETGYPCIPIMNANNRGSTYVETADVAASTTCNVTVILAELAP